MLVVSLDVLESWRIFFQKKKTTKTRSVNEMLIDLAYNFKADCFNKCLWTNVKYNFVSKFFLIENEI